MRNRHSMKAVRAASVLLAAAGMMGTFALQVQAAAPLHPPTHARYVFSSVGIVAGQTIRVSVASARLQEPQVPDKVRIRLFDTAGNVVADSEEQVLPALQTVIFDVDRDELPEGGDPGTGRFQLRATVVVTNPNGL